MGRRLRLGLIGLVLVALAASGCGGSSSSSNGEADKPAAAVFADAKQAAVAAKSVHVHGALNDSGNALALDLVLAQGKGRGSMSENGLEFEIVRIGNAAYIKGSDKFLTKFAGAAAAQLFHDKWLKGALDTGGLGALAPLTDITRLFNGAFAAHGKLVNQGETTFHGQKVVAIKDSKDGGILYVAATGTPYPIGAKEGSTAKGALSFDRWNETVSIAAPKGAIDMSKLGG